MPQPWPPAQWHCRTVGPHLTAFNRADGTRLSFGPTPPRLLAPELLDVKLTDVCSVGCAFCYQDSRPDRQHARLEDVAFIAAEAGKAGVFEVALGGGEVSEYPQFREALHLFRAAGVVPNFTTKRMRWLAREWPELRELVGGVAVSVGSAAEIRLLNKLIPAAERRAGQLVAQVVMGTVERAELLALMQEAGAAGIRVTLLGFKDVGRGQTFRPLPYDWWLANLPQYVQHTQVSIDTALAAECPAELEKLLLPGSYHTEEGRFSAYADAVSMTLAPSSYHAGPVYPFDADWLAHFAAPDFVQGPATPPAPGRVRLGFATNSSSSHSLVLLRESVEDEPKDPAEWEKTFATKYGSFTASSLEARKFYLAANLLMDCQEFFKDVPDPESLIRELCELPANAVVSHEGIDLNSAIQIVHPNPDGPGPHPRVLERVKTVLYAPMVSVFGKGDGGDDEDSPRWDSVDFVLDTADFMYMFTLPEIFEPVPPRPADLSWPLYLLGLVRGQKFLGLVQKALAAGIDWEYLKAKLLSTDEPEFENAASDSLLVILKAAGLNPPDFLLAAPGGYLADERWQWLMLYLKADSVLLDAFMQRLGQFRQQHFEFSKQVLDYAAEDLSYQALHPERLTKLMKAMDDGPKFEKFINKEYGGSYLRFTEYLAKI